MKKILFALAFLTTSLCGFSQKGDNQIGLGLDLGIPTADFADGASFGAGAYLKILLGVGNNGHITFTSGYTGYKGKNDIVQGSPIPIDKITFNIIPILAGYRHNFDGFYAEPQVGWGSFGARVKALGESGSDSEGMFTWAIGFGYLIKNQFDIGVRYQSMHENEGEIAVVGIRLGYNFPFTSGGSRKSKSSR